MEELSKFFQHSEIIELWRSEIQPAEYNPRKITEDGKKTLRRSLRNFGVLGGIIVNKRTNYTIVGGHQKVYILDEAHKYNEETQENDYRLRVEVVDVCLEDEKTLNVLLNNQNAQGVYDFDKLRDIVTEIDYKKAGLTEADLSMIGLDAIFQTEEENQLANELSEMMSQVDADHQQEVEMRRAQREAAKQANAPKTQEEKIQHMKDVKAEVKEQAMEKAAQMEAYLMLSFDSWENKVAFCERFGYDAMSKFIKGEDFENRVDGIEE